MARIGLSKIDDYRRDNVCCIRLCYLKHAVNDKKGGRGTDGSGGCAGMRVWSLLSKVNLDSREWALSPPTLPQRTRKNGAPPFTCELDLLLGMGGPSHSRQ